jgi:hypothetical protein
VAALSITLLPGCGIFPRRGPSALVGTWTNQAGTVWTIKENGTFDVDLNDDGRREAWGRYSVEGDLVTLRSTGGYTPKGCKGKGVYHFERTAEECIDGDQAVNFVGSLKDTLNACVAIGFLGFVPALLIGKNISQSVRAARIAWL